MATRTTYLIISGPDITPKSVRRHALPKEVQFESVDVTEGGSERQPTVKWTHRTPIEEEEDLHGIARQVSASFPTASVFVVTVEERFDQVERLQTHLYMNGKDAGEVEHGYVFNVGSG